MRIRQISTKMDSGSEEESALDVGEEHAVMWKGLRS